MFLEEQKKKVALYSQKGNTGVSTFCPRRPWSKEAYTSDKLAQIEFFIFYGIKVIYNLYAVENKPTYLPMTIID